MNRLLVLLQLEAVANRLTRSQRRGCGFAVAVGSGLNDQALSMVNSVTGSKGIHGRRCLSARCVIVYDPPAFWELLED